MCICILNSKGYKLSLYAMQQKYAVLEEGRCTNLKVALDPNPNPNPNPGSPNPNPGSPNPNPG